MATEQTEQRSETFWCRKIVIAILGRKIIRHKKILMLWKLKTVPENHGHTSFHLRKSDCIILWQSTLYSNDPKFLDMYAWANSADPDQTGLIRVYTVCHSVCIVWTHYSMVEPHNSNFRVITTNFLVWLSSSNLQFCGYPSFRWDLVGFWGLNTKKNEEKKLFQIFWFSRIRIL